MTAEIIDGKAMALGLRRDIANKVSTIKEKYGVVPTLAVILVGNDPASSVYVSNKEKMANSIGINSIQQTFDYNISEDELIGKIYDLNHDDTIDGILVQLPLPNHIDPYRVISAIDPNKDVDGFNVINVGYVAIGNINDIKGSIPCTPMGCISLLKSIMGKNLSGVKTLVIGTSNIVGRPLASLLIMEKCTVTVVPIVVQ